MQLLAAQEAEAFVELDGGRVGDFGFEGNLSVIACTSSVDLILF